MAVSASLGDERVAELPQGPVAYRERGSGTPVLLVHGGLVNGDLWRHVVPALAASGRYRLITPDLPMGSHSRHLRPGADVTPPGVAALLVSFLDALGLDRVVVLANDAGGAVSQLLAAAHPERVDRLVLTSCDTYGQFPPRYLKPVRWLAFVPPLGRLIARSFASRLVHGPFFRSVAHTPLPPEIRDSYLQPMLTDPVVREDLLRFFRGTRPRHTLRAARALRGFDRPALVLWAGDDLWFRRGNGRRLARTLGARFAVLPGARTFVPEDVPEELARQVDAFLAATARDAVAV